jgi:hypothetical protein
VVYINNIKRPIPPEFTAVKTSKAEMFGEKRSFFFSVPPGFTASLRILPHEATTNLTTLLFVTGAPNEHPVKPTRYTTVQINTQG